MRRVILSFLFFCCVIVNIGFAQENEKRIPIEHEYIPRAELEELIKESGADDYANLPNYPFVYKIKLTGSNDYNEGTDFLWKLETAPSLVIGKLYSEEDVGCGNIDLGINLSYRTNPDSCLILNYRNAEEWFNITQYFAYKKTYFSMFQSVKTHVYARIDIWIGSYSSLGDEIVYEDYGDCKPSFTINAYTTDHTAIIDQQTITSSDFNNFMSNTLPSQYLEKLDAPYVCELKIAGLPKEHSHETVVEYITAYLEQTPLAVIGRAISNNGNICKIGPDSDSAVEMNDVNWQEIDYLFTQELYFKTELSTNDPQDTTGVILWMSFNKSLGEYITFDKNNDNTNYPDIFEITGYKLQNDKQTEIFGYNPITQNQFQELLKNDGAEAFADQFTQGNFLNIVLKGSLDFENSVKLAMQLEDSPDAAIGRGNGQINPQSAIGDAINNQHNVSIDGWENLTDVCNSAELYTILTNEQNAVNAAELSLWFGFEEKPGNSIVFQNLMGYEYPDSIIILPYRITTDTVRHQITAGDSVLYQPGFLQICDSYYTDRGYHITSVPDSLMGLLWLQLPNDQKSNTSDTLCTVRLNGNGTVYIAYDSRAASLPNWIADQYTATGDQIGISDEAEYLDLYKRKVTSGELILGGNLAEGANGSECQYVVLLDIPETLPPVADFTHLPKSGEAPLTVQFTDQSTGLVENWAWDFSDGESSTEQNPEHTFAAADTYYVTLTVSSTDGSDSKTDTVYVTDATPVAAFSADTTSGENPLTVSFTDESSGSINAWSWDFGDGSTSTEQNPVHEYTAVDTFDVKLTVTGPNGADQIIKEDYIIVVEPLPVAQFAADITEGSVPLTVQFADSSKGTITSWFWDFGDGNTSTEQHPLHVYTKVDTYTVTLKVTGPGGIAKLSKTDYIKLQFPTGIAGLSEQPTTFALYGNYPNPFNPTTNITFDVPTAQHVSVSIYNINGSLVETLVDEHKASGRYTINWQAGNRSSGTYFIRMVTEGYTKIQKCILLK